MSKSVSRPEPFQSTYIEQKPVSTLRPCSGNARTHSDKQI